MDFEKVKQLVTGIEADAAKFYNSGNTATCTRVREAMQALQLLAGDIRRRLLRRKVNAISQQP